MNNKGTDFPQFRMMDGRKVYYKILSEREFIELHYIGAKPIFHTVKATQYPEMLRIKEMLEKVTPFKELPKEKEGLFDPTLS